jgi:hypothetical protein
MPRVILGTTRKRWYTIPADAGTYALVTGKNITAYNQGL